MHPSAWVSEYTNSNDRHELALTIPFGLHFLPFISIDAAQGKLSSWRRDIRGVDDSLAKH